jgi:hypothetical protein
VTGPDRRSRIPGLLSYKLNPTGYMAAAGTIYAAAVMVWNAAHHHGVISIPVIVAALGAAWSLYTRTAVTPVAAPRDGNGNPLVAAPQAAAITGRSFPPPPDPELPRNDPPAAGSPP